MDNPFGPHPENLTLEEWRERRQQWDEIYGAEVRRLSDIFTPLEERNYWLLGAISDSEEELKELLSDPDADQNEIEEIRRKIYELEIEHEENLKVITKPKADLEQLFKDHPIPPPPHY